MPKPTFINRVSTGSTSSRIVPEAVTRPVAPPAGELPAVRPVMLGQPGASEQELLAQAVMVTLSLDSYKIYREDDGAGGAGVDLYLGYIASGGLRSAPVKANGTTAVKSGLTARSGGVHIARQELFSRQLAPKGDIVVQVNLLEADESTSRIVEGYANASVPTFSEAVHTYSDAEVAGLMLSFVGAAVVLLIQANSDDDYGAWTLRLVHGTDRVTCRIVARDRQSVAVHPEIVVKRGSIGAFTLRYVDGENDVECAMSLSVS